MPFQPPQDLEPFQVLFDHSEPNPALPAEWVQFVGSLGFPPPPPDRPWVYANFVQSLDGIVSFGAPHPGGAWVARSRHDRWMMDLLRAHADAILCGVGSLVQETLYGNIPGGPVFRMVDRELLRFREQELGRAKLKNIIVTGSGNLQPSEYRLFRSEHVEAWIATTPQGLQRLGDPGKVRVLVFGRENTVDLGALLHALRVEYGVQYLLCEGGPALYGHMVRGGWVDEKFLTVAPQEIGLESSSEPGLKESKEAADDSQRQWATTRRLTSFAGPGFTVENAPWYRWVSCRKAGDHEFNRYRVRRPGPPERGSSSGAEKGLSSRV